MKVTSHLSLVVDEEENKRAKPTNEMKLKKNRQQPNKLADSWQVSIDLKTTKNCRKCVSSSQGRDEAANISLQYYFQ